MTNEQIAPTMISNRACEDINLKNNDTYRQVFDRFYVPLCIFAEQYIQNHDQANDIVQECFIKLWQLKTDFFYLHQVKSFLYTSVRNRALNEIEHLQVTEEYIRQTLAKEGGELFFQHHVIEEETYRILYEAIDSLPPQMQAIIKLALEGMSNREIAQSLNISSETVHTLKKIAYRKLRECLKEYYYLLFFLI